MNKRIKELVDQILPNEKEWHKGDPKDWGYFFSGNELEKFAELIVRECANRMGEEIVYNNAYKERNKAISDMIEVVKQHFGVKE